MNDRVNLIRISGTTKILKRTNKLFVLTGAGVSAESGIPTFRGKDGLWKNYSATDLATPEAFETNPKLVWEWYHWRQEIILKARPNPAHYAIVELERKCEKFLLLTQNVDNLHRVAGSKNVLELHGNIFRSRCLGCGKIVTHQIFQSPLMPSLQKEDTEGFDNLPRCPCGGLLRPDVVWFGEPIPQDIWETAIKFLNSADAAIICGTSGVVWPAAAIPEMAKNFGTKIIEINLESTPISTIVDISIIGKAGEILPKIISHLS